MMMYMVKILIIKVKFYVSFKVAYCLSESLEASDAVSVGS